MQIRRASNTYVRPARAGKGSAMTAKTRSAMTAAGVGKAPGSGSKGLGKRGPVVGPPGRGK